MEKLFEQKILAGIAQTRDLFESMKGVVVFDDDDLDDLDPKQKRQWKGYHYKMTYETWDEESIEIGETDDRGWVTRRSERFDTLDDLLNDSDIRHKGWLEWSSSHPNPAHDWLISSDDENYSTGERTQYHLWIERGDRVKLSAPEMLHINKALGVH